MILHKIHTILKWSKVILIIYIVGLIQITMIRNCISYVCILFSKKEQSIKQIHKKQQHHEIINLNLLKIFAQNLILIKGYFNVSVLLDTKSYDDEISFSCKVTLIN